MMWNVPNILTILRIALIPFFVGIFYLPVSMTGTPVTSQYWVNTAAAVVFALASFTDWLDGYWARKYQQMSNFGAFLDPVADKLMVTAALIVLVELERVGAVIALIIIGREIAIGALREWMASVGERSSVAVAQIGKIKTATQMLAIELLLFHDPIGLFQTQRVGYILIVIAAVLTLVSMAYYLKASWPKFMQSIHD